MSNLERLIYKNKLLALIRFNQERNIIIEAVNLVFQESKFSEDSIIQRLSINAKTEDFIRRNNWLIEKLRTIRSRHRSPEEALKKIKEHFREWLSDSFEDTHIRKNLVLLRSLADYIKRARNEPKKYPKTTEFLMRIRILNS
ncbi:MAG: hypothetical protein NZL96_03275 [Patescibacteria group bacterium]|nr:hypothetical protein [Patescibacteria group bacterium]